MVKFEKLLKNTEKIKNDLAGNFKFQSIKIRFKFYRICAPNLFKSGNFENLRLDK